MADVLSSEMIEVDPKLFITCRLCLEEMGVYQIVPTVQQQIKFCFDINVEPFDGLPQLLCKKCKGLLDEYSSNKKKYIEKQTSLIAKLKVKQVQNIKSEDKADFRVSSSSFALPNSATASRSRSSNSSSSANKEPIKTTAKEHELVLQPVSINSADNSAYDSECNIRPPGVKSLTNHRKRKNRLMSNSSSGTEVSTHSKKKTKKHQSKSLKWHRKYKKQYVCNICSNTYDEKRKLKKHFDAHSYIKSKYGYILNKGCRVKLIKSDGKPNITNLDNTIIFDKGKIIQDAGNFLYHVLYTKRDTDKISSKAKSKKHKADYSESSEDDFIVSRKDKRKCRRISRSSNETVLLEDTNKTLESCNADDVESSHKKPTENEATECINIDDSSDNNTDLENNAISKQTTETKVEFKTIENIISNCRLKYMKKLEVTQNGSNNSSKKMIYSEMQLKHKLLSIGRKNIYKEGQFNCTGLLRFMEHKNLNVLWLPKDNRESLVRIMTKLKSAKDNENTIEKCGWTTLPETGRGTPDINRIMTKLKSASDNENTIEKCGWTTLPETGRDTPDINNVTKDSIELSATENKSPVLSKSNTAINNTESVNTSHTLPVADYATAILYTDCAADVDVNSKKILNQSPVANPKQLPKKSNVSDTKAKNVADVVNNKSFVIDLDEEQTRQLLEEENYGVPIITSTTSLAEIDKIEKAQKEKKSPEKSVPRIKVKPVSELMNPPSARVNENSNRIWAVNNLANRVTPNNIAGNAYITLVPQIQNVQSLQRIAPAPEQNVLPVTRVTSQAPSAPSTECIVLNSVELPNTRTDSPFKYLKDLLLIHNIFLLDPNVLITREYLGLLKIKVQFKQESKDVVLCLSLFCLRNAFCICIKDSNNVDIPMNKISANWQWEIIKIFQGDLSNQILNNSMKAGQQMYVNTQTFLYLLKSITSNQQ